MSKEKLQNKNIAFLNRMREECLIRHSCRDCSVKTACDYAEGIMSTNPAMWNNDVINHEARHLAEKELVINEDGVEAYLEDKPLVDPVAQFILQGMVLENLLREEAFHMCKNAKAKWAVDHRGKQTILRRRGKKFIATCCAEDKEDRMTGIAVAALKALGMKAPDIEELFNKSEQLWKKRKKRRIK